MAVDIVCGKEVSETGVDSAVGHVPAGAPETDPSAGTKRFYKGKWYYFDSMACRIRFVADPETYIANAEGTSTEN